MSVALTPTPPANRVLRDLVPQHPTAYFNLGIEPWIPVITDQGAERVGLAAVLLRSHEIHDLAVIDPLEKFSLIRYLLALVYLARAYEPDGDWLSAARGQNGDWPPLPSEGLGAVVERMSDQWWLFHPDHPFAQTPELISLMSKSVSETDTLETVTEGFECLVPFRPAKSNESWWYKSDGQYLSHAAAPLVLLSRHFAAVMGNEAGILGKDKSRCEGGVMVAGPQDITSLILDADRLSATLAGNLVCGITEAITTKSVLFFEAPTEVAAHIDDPLYRFTASGAAAFLVWPGVGSDTSRVLRAPLPVPPDVTKKLMMSARLSDPHVLRALQPAGTPDANNSNKGIIAFSSSATQFENVFALYRKVAIGMEGLRTNIITTDSLTYQPIPSSRRLAGVTVSGGGNFTGMRIVAATAVTLKPEPLALEGARAQTLRHMLGHLADSSDSCLSQLSYEVGQVIGGGAKPGAAKSRAIRAEAAASLWADVEGSVENLYRSIADVPLDQLPAELPAELRISWIEATVRVFDAITATYVRSPRARARVYEHRLTLRRALWSKL